MKIKSLKQTRRTFLSIATTSVTAILSGCDFFSSPSIEQQMIRSLNHLPRAKQIGQMYRQSNPKIRTLSVLELSDAILAEIDLSREQANQLSQQQMTNHLGEKIRQDFADENIIILGRWMFANMDLLLCTLASIYKENQLD